MLAPHCLIVLFSPPHPPVLSAPALCFSPPTYLYYPFNEHGSTPPLACTPLLLRYYCRYIPQGYLLHCSRFSPLPQSSSLPAVCRSRRRNPGRRGLGRTAAWLAGKTRLTSWPGSRRAATGGQSGHTAGTESEKERTGWTWTLWTRSVCC